MVRMQNHSPLFVSTHAKPVIRKAILCMGLMFKQIANRLSHF